MRLGVKHGKGWKEGMDSCGEHESNPTSGQPNLDHFHRGGGFTGFDFHRSDVDHFHVGRGPFIAHPLDGPGKAPYLEELGDVPPGVI